jgi:uncharacterized protein DUF4352
MARELWPALPFGLDLFRLPPAQRADSEDCNDLQLSCSIYGFGLARMPRAVIAGQTMSSKHCGAALKLARQISLVIIAGLAVVGAARAQIVAHADGFRLGVIKFQRAVAMANSKGVTARANGAYLLVWLSVTNDSSQPRTFDVSGFRCVDRQGRAFELAREPLDSYLRQERISDGIVKTTIPPNFTKQISVMFDVSFEDKDFTLFGPNSREGLSVHLH